MDFSWAKEMSDKNDKKAKNRKEAAKNEFLVRQEIFIFLTRIF